MVLLARILFLHLPLSSQALQASGGSVLLRSIVKCIVNSFSDRFGPRSFETFSSVFPLLFGDAGQVPGFHRNCCLERLFVVEFIPLLDNRSCLFPSPDEKFYRFSLRRKCHLRESREDSEGSPCNLQATIPTQNFTSPSKVSLRFSSSLPTGKKRGGW